MIFLPFVLFFLVVAQQTLTYSTCKHPRVIWPSRAVPIPFCNTKPQTSLCDSLDSANVPNEQQEKLRAVEYCLDHIGSIIEPMDADESFRKLVRRYRRFSEDGLTKLAIDLTALISKTAVDNRGTFHVGSQNVFVILKLLLTSTSPIPIGICSQLSFKAVIQPRCQTS